MKQFIPAESLDFNQYKNSLKEFLRTYHGFTDYDFEGSNITVLVDLLAYNTYNIGLYANMIGSESFMDSAQLRASIVSHAKDLNYLPRSRTAAFSTLTVEVVPNDTPPSIVIPKGYRFKTSHSSGGTLYFTTRIDTLLQRDVNGRYIGQVQVHQGDLITQFFIVDGCQIQNNGVTTYSQTFNISSANIDVSSLEVSIKENQTSDEYIKFTRAEDLFGVNSDSLIYFVRGYRDNFYTIEFGDGVFGSPLTNQNVIKIEYLDTLGDQIYGNYVFTKTDTIQGYSNISILESTRVYGGAEREDTESIRNWAPKYHQTQNRAVTDVDYETLIRTNFSWVQDVNAFGGEEVYQYGKMMIVIKPYGRYGIISNNLKREVIEYLKTKNIVTEPIIIDPEYFYLSIAGNVFYDGPTSLKSQVETAVNTSLLSMNNSDKIGKFNSTIFQSDINEQIRNNSHPSIVGSDIDMSLIRVWNPQVNITEKLSFRLDNPIIKSVTGLAYSSDTRWGVTSTQFMTIVDGVEVPAIIRDNGIGTIHLYSVQDGSVMKRIESVGNVDYVNGEVNITLKTSGYINTINVECVLDRDSISVSRDKFMIVDTRYNSIEVQSR